MKGRFAGRLISAGIVLLLILMVPQNSFANPPLAENNYVEISGKVIVRGGNPIESLIFIWYGDINRTLSVSPDGTFYTVIFTNQTSILNITAVSPYGHINRTYQIPYLPYRIHTEFRFNATNHINPPTSPQVYINTSKEEHNLAHSPDFTVSFYIKNEPIICGDKITLKVLIRNIGTYYLRVKYNVLIDDVIVAEKKVNLTGYAYEDVLNVSSPAAHGTHTLKIIVDPYNEVEELIEDIKLGVFIKNYMEWNIDDIRWNQRYVGLEAYLIENGELKKLVRNPVLEITTKGFYSKIVGVDKNLKFYPGTCGKGEPAQGVPVWFGGPNVRLSKIYLGVVRA